MLCSSAFRRMHEYIADDIGIYSDSVREDSDEENSRRFNHTMWIKRLLISFSKQFIKYSYKKRIKYFL